MINKPSPVQAVNLYLKNKRIPKYQFDDLKFVFEEIKILPKKRAKQILDCFRFVQGLEIVGWRPKSITRKIIEILSCNSKENPLVFYALFCPSYKKGKGAFGFRTDDVGNTTLAGIKNLCLIYYQTQKLGFYCLRPLAIFFDLAIEQAEKVIKNGGLDDLEKNVENFRKHLPPEIEFIKLSKLSKSLFKKIGYGGIILNPLPVPQKTFSRIVERGKKFYKIFGWTNNEVLRRSKIIASSEALVGKFLKKKFKNGIMIYTPTMLERGAVYSGFEFNTNPLPIIFPKKEGS